MNELSVYVPHEEKTILSRSMADCGSFGMKSSEQAFSLFYVAEAEGRHPATIVNDYHFFKDGRYGLKAEAVHARFRRLGGRVEWKELTDKKAYAKFSNANGEEIELVWTIEMAQKAGIVKADSAWIKYPRAMLRSRLVAEAVRTICPEAINGHRVADEIADEIMEKDITPTSDEKKMTKQGFIAMKAQQVAERSVNVIDSVAEEKTTAIEHDKELKYSEIQILELRDAKKVDESTFNSWLLKSGFSSLEEADIETINKMGKYLESL